MNIQLLNNAPSHAILAEHIHVQSMIYSRWIIIGVMEIIFAVVGIIYASNTKNHKLQFNISSQAQHQSPPNKLNMDQMHEHPCHTPTCDMSTTVSPIEKQPVVLKQATSWHLTTEKEYDNIIAQLPDSILPGAPESMHALHRKDARNRALCQQGSLAQIVRNYAQTQRKIAYTRAIAEASDPHHFYQPQTIENKYYI